MVIGNDDYKYLPNLNNAGRDARDMASKLKFLGFDVIRSFNASERDMGRAIRRFASKLSNGGTGLVFYAGHGIQANGKNYLIPVDAELEDEGDLEFAAIDADTILRAMRDAGNELNIVIMDACRNNPLPKSSRGVGVTRLGGLAAARMPDGAKGTAIIYAAGPGQTAADGKKGRNGIFTGALLRHMDKPGWSLEQVFKATVREVLAKTNQKQRPWQQLSMQGDFYFRAKPANFITADNSGGNKNGLSRTVAPALKIIQSNSGATDIALWRAVQNSKDPAMYRAYLNKFPNGTFAEIAKIKLAGFQATTKDTGTKQPELKLIPVGADFVTLRSANVRLKPDLNGARVTTLPSGARVRVKSKTLDGKWLHLERNGQTLGYVYHTLLRTQKSIDDERKRAENQRREIEKKRLAGEERRRVELALRNKRNEARRLREREQARLREAQRKRRAEAERRRLASLRVARTPAPVDRNMSGKRARSLAWKYYSGTGGYSKNYTLAARYYYHASNRGNAAAMHGLGYMYQKGLGVKKNMRDAYYWYKRSAEKNYLLAYSNLAPIIHQAPLMSNWHG